MEYDKIKQLIDDMGNSKLTSVDIEFPDGTKISMKKEKAQILEKEVVLSQDDSQNLIVENNNIEKKAVDNFKIIKSPIVGTFYSKPSPTSAPYVQVGNKVKKGQTVCIVEAMKLMNEIESEFDGEVAEIFVDDGGVVEYGTPLIALK